MVALPCIAWLSFGTLQMHNLQQLNNKVTHFGMGINGMHDSSKYRYDVCEYKLSDFFSIPRNTKL